MQAARAGLKDIFKKPAAMVGCGGSIPVVGDLQKQLGLDSILVGFGLADDHIHSPNEKFELKWPEERDPAAMQRSSLAWVGSTSVSRRPKPLSLSEELRLFFACLKDAALCPGKTQTTLFSSGVFQGHLRVSRL